MSGKVVADPIVFEDGMKSILLQTHHTEARYSITAVYVSPNENITAGQCLYVAGRLNSNQFKTVDDKRRQQYSVSAKNISPIDKRCPDINSVELHVSVAGRIFSTNEFSQFPVVATYKLK